MADNLITYSSELIRNFKQAEVASAEAKFEALQTDTGCSLLFSIGTDDVFYVTQETPGHATGWAKIDLTTALAADYGAGATVSAKTFAVAQNRVTSALQLAVVVTVGGTDNLYVSLGNSSSDTSWTAKPAWVRLPFDDGAHPLAKVSIVNVFISEASDGEYIAVDVLRNAADPVPVIFRYFIDPTKKTIAGQAWTPHDVANDLDATKVTSCLGRRAHDRIDGLYTLGQIAGHTSLVFQPLVNVFDPTIPANPARLVVPQGSAPSAIAAVAMNGNLTDLFVACERALYYFANNAQKDGAVGVKVSDNALLEGVQRLFAFATSSKVIVWGLNRADQVFYTTCDRAHITSASAWSVSLPIISGAEQISPYVNRANDGNTFFAHTGVNEFQRVVQDPSTTLWKAERILLPPLSRTAKAVSFSSYTTRVQVTDASKTPLADVPVMLGAVGRTNVYINNRYYVLTPEPIPVPTDKTGGLVIVERVENLQGTVLQVHGSNGAIIEIDPMAKPFQRAASITTTDQLTAAAVPNYDGTTKPLVASSTSSDDKTAVVAAIGNLSSAYSSLPGKGASSPAPRAAGTPVLAAIRADTRVSLAGGAASFSMAAAPVRALGFGDAIESAAGDVLGYLESAKDYVVHVVQDAADGAWHFIAEIGGKMYRFVLDAAAKVVGALEFVFKYIKTLIEDLIRFLEFLFAWKDFVRTKDVHKKLLILFLNHQIDNLETLKDDFNSLLGSARGTIDSWAGIAPDTWAPGMENGSKGMGFVQTLTDYGQVFTAPGMFIFHHFMDNVGGATSSATATTDPLTELLQRIVQALEDEGNVFVDAVRRIKSQLLDGSAFQSMSLGDILKKLVAIIADAVLNTAENLIDLMLDVLSTIAKAAMSLLDAPIWIPVLSDILEFFGVSIDFSLLDIICMIGAIPATLVYKFTFDKAPYSSGDG